MAAASQWLAGLCLLLFSAVCHASVCSTVTNAYPSTTSATQYSRSTPVCFYMTSSPTNVTFVPQPIKVQFFPTCDEYTLLKLDGSFSLANLTAPSTIQLQFGQVVSPVKNYKWIANGVTYAAGFLTAIINVDGGNVQSIEWDEGCFTCGGDACNSGFCGSDVTAGCNGDCDLKVYLAWDGTDSDDKILSSKGSVYSQFRDFSAKTAYDEGSTSAQGINVEAPSYP